MYRDRWCTVTSTEKGEIAAWVQPAHDIADGLYLLTIQVGDEQQSIKVVVAR